MLIDVAGVLVGHTNLGDTGVTAVCAGESEGMRAAVDVRGGGPGTRETDLLEPHNTVEKVHAIMLCGGSAFGLAAADGAMRAIAKRGGGFPVFGDLVPDGPSVPIVPAAVIFDLAVGDAGHWPDQEDGAAAVEAAYAQAEAENASSGNVGAGCGATAGVLKGGFGRASVSAAGYNVAAYVVANPVGNVVDPETGLLYGDPSQPAVDLERFNQLQRPMPGGAPGHADSALNTTIGVIATDAPLTVAQLKRLAMTGHDGIARAVRPAHSPLDGDTLFAVSVGRDEEVGVLSGAVDKLAALGEAAAQCVQAAIVDAVTHAHTAHGVTAWRDIAEAGTPG